MTADESETSAIPSDRPSADADQELWLTYLNYDQAIQQAVRRLSALSSRNVDEFRGLLLKGRDRGRVKEYEAESIRRLQGEAFVGDEELQRTLIVLNAEDPRFGEELKRLVAATGKPSQLDQAVAEIRSGKQVPRKPERSPDPSPQRDHVRESVVVPLRKERISPPQPLREESPVPKRGLKLVAAAGAVILIAAVAGVLVAPRLFTGDREGDLQTAAATSVAKPRTVAPSAPPVQHAPAPAVNIPIPAQADKGATSSPPLRPASTQPDAPANAATVAPAQEDVSPNPVAGAKYKVVRGDMLSDIALKVYGDASKFRLIQAANPDIRNKPNRILVDQVIFIPADNR